MFGGTFLTFSDYMRGAVRLAAMMGLPVTYVWTHDSIGLGEDGPTHQPIEHLAALRAIPGLDVVRPADANETAACWQAILEHTDRPGRPDPHPSERPDVPAGRGRLQRHRQRAPRRLRAASTPRRRGEARPTSCSSAPARRSSSPSRRARSSPRRASAPGSSRCRAASGSTQQDASYRETVIPPTVKARVSVEAGVAQGWREVVGDHGRIVSIEHYGASADFARIFREFGVTAEAVAAAAEDSIRVATG